MVNRDSGKSFLECLLEILMYLSVFHSPVLGPVISAVFLERLLYLSLPFPKQFYLSDMTDTEWSGTWKTSHYFSYQKVKLVSGSKITCTMSLYLQDTQYVSISPKPFGNEITKILGSCRPQFPEILWRCSRFLKKSVYLYPLINPCF